MVFDGMIASYLNLTVMEAFPTVDAMVDMLVL